MNSNEPVQVQNGSLAAYPAIDPPFAVGLTKRELFSAMAMQGMLSSGRNNTCEDNVAVFAVKHADDLLAELGGVKPLPVEAP